MTIAWHHVARTKSHFLTGGTIKNGEILISSFIKASRHCLWLAGFANLRRDQPGCLAGQGRTIIVV
jgi:hypothetical protein